MPVGYQRERCKRSESPPPLQCSAHVQSLDHKGLTVESLTRTGRDATILHWNYPLKRFQEQGLVEKHSSL